MKQFHLIKSQKWNRERERIDRMKLPNKKNNPVFSLMSHHQLDLQDPNEAVNHSADKSNYQVIFICTWIVFTFILYLYLLYLNHNADKSKNQVKEK